MNRNFRRESKGNPESLDLLVCSPLAELGVPHGFSLRWRHWGAEEASEPFGVRGRGSADREELAAVLGLSRVARMRQVHGADVRGVSEPMNPPPVCDGLATSQKGLGLIVSTADCVPMVMWDEEKKVAAVVHTGWRGALGELAGKAVAHLTERFGSRATSLHVALGPAIGVCCYEVGDDVTQAFESRFAYAGRLFSPGPRGKSHLDLIEANREQLSRAGVPSEQVYVSDMCTSCDNQRLYSYRKEGKGVGRIMGAIGVT
jgi:YfiH family protein